MYKNHFLKICRFEAEFFKRVFRRFEEWWPELLAPGEAASFYRRRASAADKRYSGKRVEIFGEARFHLLLMTGIFP